MEPTIFVLWLIAFAIASIPPLGRWVFGWFIRIKTSIDQALEEWTQNLLRSQLV